MGNTIGNPMGNTMGNTMGTTDRPFRFLDLPQKLRLEVYKRLPVHTFHHTIPCLKSQEDAVILITHGVAVQVLATCQKIHKEAKPILMAKVSRIQARIPRIILDCDPYRYKLWRDDFEIIMIAVLRRIILQLHLPAEEDGIFGALYKSRFLWCPDDYQPVGIQKFLHQAGMVSAALYHNAQMRMDNSWSPIHVCISLLMTGGAGDLSEKAPRKLPLEFVGWFRAWMERSFLVSSHQPWYDPSPFDGNRTVIGFPTSFGPGPRTLVLGRDADRGRLWEEGWIEGECL